MCLHRFENMDWDRFDALFEEAKKEVILEESAKKMTIKKKIIPLNWHSKIFYMLFDLFHGCKK